MRSGQASFEFLGVTIIVIVLLIIVMTVALDIYRGQREAAAVADTRVAANILGETVNLLCVSPINTTLSKLITIPRIVDLPSSSITNRTVAFVIATDRQNQTIITNTDCTVNGTLPAVAGTLRFTAKRFPTQVKVNVTPTIQ